LVESSIVFAQAMGISELVIGLTIVAAGTSMPEVVTSIVASVRGERDIAVGNVVGSNLFNLLGVLGAAALVASDGLEVHPAVLRFDLPVMTAVAFACLPIFFTGMRIARWEGAVLLFYYAAYAAYLVLQATQHDALPGYSLAMRWFALPITGLTMLVTVGQALKRRRNDARRTRPA
jgi:cation:H+ antiporter